MAPHAGIARAFGVVDIAPMPPYAYRTYEFCVHPKILCVESIVIEAQDSCTLQSLGYPSREETRARSAAI